MCLGSILSLRLPFALRKPAWAGFKPRRLLLHIATAYEMFELREAGTAVRAALERALKRTQRIVADRRRLEKGADLALAHAEARAHDRAARLLRLEARAWREQKRPQIRNDFLVFEQLTQPRLRCRVTCEPHRLDAPRLHAHAPAGAAADVFV